MTTSPDSSPRTLIESCQGLVRSLAIQVSRKFHGKFELDDLIAYGQVGLAEAAQDYQPDRGAQFSTYAYYRIRGAIYDGISRMSWIAGKPPPTVRFQQLAGETLEHSVQEHPAGESGDDARWLVDMTSRLAVVYLATSASGHSAIDSQPAPGAPPGAAILNRELDEQLHRAVDALPDEQRSLIRLTYFDGLTLQDAAQKLGISKSWASRLHGKCLQTLAHSLRQVGFAD